MKTIAVSVDESTLRSLDALARPPRGHRTHRARKLGLRSRIVRTALQEYLSRLERIAEEKRERVVWDRNLARINRQAAILVREQAEP